MKKALVLLCLALGACITAGKRGGDGAPAVYDLGPPAARLADVAGLPPLALEVRAPHWFDSLGIEYRLAYAEPAQLRDYAQARWAAPPAGLVKQRLVQQLGLLPPGQGGAKCLLRVDIDEFSQIFDSPEASRGVLHARLALLDRRSQPLAALAWKIERPAPSQDSRGAVAALTAAVTQLGQDLGRWQGELVAQGKLKGCGP